MRGGSKTLIVALVALLLAAGLVACGGDDSDSPTTEAASQAQAGGNSDGSAAGDGGSGKSDSDGGSASGGGENQSDEGDTGNFKPKQHDDSGGGSEQFRLKGGDNSVQEFGEEAEPSEFNAAARALHNFLDARAEGEWEAACAYLASEVVESLETLAAQAKQLEETDCAGILGKLTNPAAKGALLKEAEKADVGSLRIEDDRAFVIYRGLSGSFMAMAMSQEDGEWKVASLAGTPLN